jgi:hypothetical protein
MLKIINGGIKMYLMSKDEIIAQINFDTIQFKVIKPDLMPFALRGNGVNIFTFRDWLSDRVLNISRSNAKKIISALGLNQNDRISMCYACKGLSLTDCFWLKTENDILQWSDVNLYENSLSKAIAHIALTGEYISIQGKVRTPELTGGGSYAKCWKRGKDGIYLYKTGALQGTGKEHLVEVFCSDLLDNLDVDHVKYDLATSNNREVSRCKNITNTKISICDMEYFGNYCNRNGIDLNKWLSNQELYYKMLIVDYIMLNSDRHSGNWGVYFNADNGKVIGLHPLFDHNLCLDPNTDYKSKVINGKTLEQCAKYAKQKVCLNTDSLTKWVKKKEVKQRLNKIDHRGIYYESLIHRINTYNKW